MSDEAGRFTAEHTVMDKDLEIRELKHLLVVKDEKIKELESQIVQLKSPDYPKGDVDYAIADETEDEFTEQLSFSFKQE